MKTYAPIAKLRAVPHSVVRRELERWLDRMGKCDEPVVITRHSRPYAVMVSVEIYSRLLDAESLTQRDLEP